MPNTELADIEASLQMLARRAYNLGRDDALKKVVAVLNGDRPLADQLALMAPSVVTPESQHEKPQEPEHEKMNGVRPIGATTAPPWWAWPVR